MQDPTIDGFGVSLYYGDTSETATTEITQVTELQPPPMTWAKVDTSHLKTANKVKTYKGGWGDPGSITGTKQYDADSYDALMQIGGVMKFFRIVFPDGAETIVEGFIEQLGKPVDREGIITNDFSIAVSGVIDFTPPVGS